MKIILQSYDSRIGNHSYANWTSGSVYTVQSNGEEVNFAVLSYEYTYKLLPDQMAEFLAKAGNCLSSQKVETPISEMSDKAFSVLVEVLGETSIPWEQTKWGSLEEYNTSEAKYLYIPLYRSRKKRGASSLIAELYRKQLEREETM